MSLLLRGGAVPPDTDGSQQRGTPPVIEDGQRLLDAARECARVAAAHAATHDRETTFPVEAFDALAACGLLAAVAPPEHGGVDFDGSAERRLLLLDILRCVGHGDLSTGRVYEGHVNALQLIHAFARPEQAARWAADARERSLLSAVWNTQDADGLRLVESADGFTLEGAKTFASGAGRVDRPVVTATLPDGGRQMLVVPMERALVRVDTEWWDPIGMRASVSHRVDFTGTRVEPNDLFGAPDDYQRQPWLGAGAIRFAAVQAGGAQALLDATLDALRSLGRTGDPHQQARAGQAAALVESGRLWLQGAARNARLGPDAEEHHPERAVAYANLMRSAIERICLDVMEIALRSVGARAVVQPHPIERIARDLTVYLRQPAPDAALVAAGDYALNSGSDIESLWNDGSDRPRSASTD